MSTDYIPQADRKFLVWVKNLFAQVEANAQPWNLNPNSWKHIDPPMIQAYDTALAKAEDPNRGVADTLEKNETRDTLKTETRKYVNEHLKYNSLISDEERKHMGLPVRDRKPTPAREPYSLSACIFKSVDFPERRMPVITFIRSKFRKLSGKAVIPIPETCAV
jgi:hypothetical protein